MIWDCILCNCILLNWWLCNIVKSIGYVFEQRYEKYVFYDMTFMFGMFIIAFVKCFISRKILKAYYGFRVLYVFPFPSAGHWPLVSGRDKVGIRALIAIDENWCIVLCFLFTTAAIRLKFVIVIFIVLVFRCLNFVLCLFKLREELRTFLLLNQQRKVNIPF